MKLTRTKFISYKIFLVLLTFISVLSCKKENKIEEEIAKINIDITIERFDKLFASASKEDLPQLKVDYPFMFSKKYTDSFWIAKINDTLQQQLSHEVVTAFPELNIIEPEIQSFFQHLKYYFPESKTPRIITATSYVDYRNKVIVTDSLALISLDTYLGSDHEFYQGIQKYLTQNFNEDQIIIDLANQYSKRYIFQLNRKTLLDEMIYAGKQLYFNDMVVPFKTDADKIGYTKLQLDWAKENESEIWKYFIEEEMLFSTDTKLLARFINPAPFSKFYLEVIDNESPGKIGQYIGWQIVKSYMNNNEVSFIDMLEKSTKEIFDNAKFKPRK